MQQQTSMYIGNGNTTKATTTNTNDNNNRNSTSTVNKAIATEGPIHYRHHQYDNSMNATATSSKVKRSTSGASLSLMQSSVNHPSSSRLESTADTDHSSYGRWTRDEHEAFLEGLKLHGREWKKVSEMISTRTSAQIRSHAQKYFSKLAKEGGPAHDALAYHPTNSYTSVTFAVKVEMIMKDPARVEQEVESRLIQLHELHQRLQAKLSRKKPKRVHTSTGISTGKSEISINNSSGSDDDVKKLMLEAEKEMMIKKSSAVSSEACKGRSQGVGPATAALANQPNYNNFDVASAPVSTVIPTTTTKAHSISKKMKHSISNDEMIALEVLGTGALSTPTFGGRTIIKKQPNGDSSQENAA